MKSVPSRLTVTNVERMYKNLGYPLFYSPYDLNIFGVRALDPNTNTFNDWLCVLFTGDDHARYVRVFPGTTDPGTHWLKFPMNPAGTAIVAEGYYRKLWTLGLHRGKPGLRQLGDVKVWRDRDKDHLAEIGGAFQIGWFAINMHRAGRFSQLIGRWSAGCQVFQKKADLLQMLDYVRDQGAHGYGTAVSYALFNERDVPA